ncbi:MAG: P-loop NTPase [Betaproteobacteria bacterium]|nr:P-loop NTPase [Betaproteobacteria bacterium]
MKTYQEIAGDGGSDILGQVTARQTRRFARLAGVAHKIAVMSGKGGVGKSAVAVNLAATWAMRGRKVGIMDADLNGPSVARMLGVSGQLLGLGAGGVIPAVGPLGIKAMSMDLLLPREETTPVAWDAPTQQHAFVWRGSIEASALGELLADTDWGGLDVLLVDLPPGAERLPNLWAVLPELDGAIAVTIPSEVAQLAVKRSIVAAQLLKVKLLGLVENMAGYVCPQCGALGELFPGDGEKAARACGVAFLGRIPFDPRIAGCSDQGVPFAIGHADTRSGDAMVQIARKIEERLPQEESRR